MKTHTAVAPKPRNLTVLTLRNCRGGTHGKSRKAQRRSEKISLRREVY